MKQSLNMNAFERLEAGVNMYVNVQPERFKSKLSWTDLVEV